MKPRLRRFLLMGCWLGWLAICWNSIFRSDPKEGNQSAMPAPLKTNGVLPTDPTVDEPEKSPLASAKRRAVRGPNQRIVWPMVLQDIHGLTPAEEAAKIRVMEEFIERIGGEDQDGNDPAYRERWLALQPLADQQFRVLIGQEAFTACEMRIAQAAYSASVSEQ